MRNRVAGTSLIAFGVASIMNSILAAILLEGFIVDFAAVIVICLGMGVARGSRAAMKWALGVMVLYLLLGLALTVIAVVKPEIVNFAGRPISSAMLPWAVASGVVVATWAAINTSLLVKAESAE